jgi:hypothetical protein
MSGQLASALFFIPLERRPPSDQALFEALGCAGGTLGPLAIADRGVDVLEFHACAWVSFLRSAFFELVRHDHEIALEQDPALPLAFALRDGAARAGADVAALVTEAHMIKSPKDWYWMVTLRDAYSLLQESFPLLHLGEAVVRDWDPPPGLLASRDELPGSPGRTFFAQRGRDRWY